MNDVQALRVESWRKRPLEVEVVVFTGFDEAGNGWQVLDWIHRHGGKAVGEGRDIVIHTLEGGDFYARPGDRIIHGPRNDFYPCRVDTFLATYERVPS